MIKTLIIIVVVIMVAIGGWGLYQYWGNYSDDKPHPDQAQAAVALDPRSLPGLSGNLEDSLNKSQARGAAGLREWLKYYGKSTQDPRLAWIQLDYAVLVAPTSPAEAKKVFAEVQERIAPTSPVYPRIKQLEKTFE